MANFLEAEKNGCAFLSDGSPCVAQRVCPIPIFAEVVLFKIDFSNSTTFPFFLKIFILFSFSNAIPALSYPRYSNLFNPSIIIGYACLFPM